MAVPISANGIARAIALDGDIKSLVLGEEALLDRGLVKIHHQT